jgi:hypothetical protein
MAGRPGQDQVALTLSSDLTPTNAYMSIVARPDPAPKPHRGTTYMSESLARGLRNVVMDTTQSSFIDGEEGILLYRGYSIHDLAAQSSFE